MAKTLKRCAALLLTLVLAALLCACGGGEADDAVWSVTPSELFTEGELFDAMQTVADRFEAEFDGCVLLELTYNEERSAPAAEEWAAQYGADQAIVLTSSFKVGPTGGDGSLEPDETYHGWQWILTRSAGENWVLRTWGYG